MAGSHQALKAEPNLTPILDMVFQLITFFMLVINFKAASLDMSVQLPVIGSALPTESGERDVLILNVMPNGKLRMYGEERDVERCIAQEAQRKAKCRRRIVESGDGQRVADHGHHPRRSHDALPLYPSGDPGVSSPRFSQFPIPRT